MGTVLLVMFCIAFYAFVGGATYRFSMSTFLKDEIDDEISPVLAGVFWPFGLFFVAGIILVKKLKENKDDN